MADLDLPSDVTTWLRQIFHACDLRITEKLCNNPNIPEESLDLTWIEHLSHYSSAVTLASRWTVRVETHFLGGLRHFYGWEIADIGILLFIRHGNRIERSKVGLLQSKRLYPTSNTVIETGRIDYEIGFARLADPEDLAHSIAVQAEFEFNAGCQYGALMAGSDQVKAIENYEHTNKLAVYYQFYNPWMVPFVQRVPLASYRQAGDTLSLGTRIIPAKGVHACLARKANGHRPTLNEIAGVMEKPYAFGWPLDYFVADLLLKCREGSQFENISDDRIQNLFYRRSGPIAAAIAITIEMP
jgi:hypothetical protein